ncbi:nucleotidyltransferase family protein [Pseudalkalibacillus sp. NRS-1564]|uniref:nucleotidyltransferase family protein n=1 Tax=Pseudalkalibacillus sp. NRS-1564 TaxID=3233900 RepID=UPI003D265498
MPYFNQEIGVQKEGLEHILYQNPAIEKALGVLREEFDHAYIGAGCIVQTVWNDLTNRPLDYGIHDLDVVYYDDQDLSLEKEVEIEEHLRKLLSDIPYKIDAKNEARVHLWYEEKFGQRIAPYSSVEDAINSWPTTATSIGVKVGEDGAFQVYTPYGLNDLFGLIVRANKFLITRDVYEAKVEKWTRKWPELEVIAWDK